MFSSSYFLETEEMILERTDYRDGGITYRGRETVVGALEELKKRTVYHCIHSSKQQNPLS